MYFSNLNAYSRFSRNASADSHSEDKARYELFCACHDGRVDVLDVLLQKQSVCLEKDGAEAIATAIRAGHTEIVKRLLPMVKADTSSLWEAVTRGHTEIVKLLLEDGGIDPSSDGDNVLSVAISNGHAAIVALLLNDGRVDPNAPNAYDCFALQEAVFLRKNDIVDLLLNDPRVDPCASDYGALRHAILGRVDSITDRLAQDPRTYQNGKFPNQYPLRAGLLSAISRCDVPFQASQILSTEELIMPDVRQALRKRHHEALRRVLPVIASDELQSLQLDLQIKVIQKAFGSALFSFLSQEQQHQRICNLVENLNDRILDTYFPHKKNRTFIHFW